MKDSQIPFTASPRILAHLGEELIKSDNTALIELVKNSYDADAFHCTVNFDVADDPLQSRIIVSDDGKGMSYDDVVNKWAVIGVGSKKASDRSPLGRYPLGEKGIGRLGVHKLGKKIDIFTKTKDGSEIHVNIDWINLESAKTLDDQKIIIHEDLSNYHFKEQKHGTIIVIGNLKTQWDSIKIKSAQNELTSLNSAHSSTNEQFEVKIECSKTEWIENLPSISEIKNEYGMYFGTCEISGNEITAFSYEFKPWSNLTLVQKRTLGYKDLKDTDKNPFKIIKSSKNKKNYINLQAHAIGTIKLNIAIFETDNAVFSINAKNKKILRNFLNQNGGIRVYRDGMRVYDYGEKGNDWLGLDIQRVHNLGAGISNNIIIGEVFLNRKDSSDLKEKTNREGFIEDDAFNDFKDAVRFALNIFIRERNIDKGKISKSYSKNKSKSVHNLNKSIESAIDAANEYIQNDDQRKEMIKKLNDIEFEYNKIRDILIRSANVGLNFSSVMHEIDKTAALLIASINNKNYEAAEALGQRLSEIINGFIKISKTKKPCLFKASQPIKFIENTMKYRFNSHGISIQCPSSDLKIFGSAEVITSLLLNLIDNAIFWTDMNEKISKKITVFATDSIPGFASIVVADSGPGFNMPADIAVEPFISGKPDGGMGLGLHIVNQYLISINGALKFPDLEELNVPDEIDKSSYKGACVAICIPINSGNNDKRLDNA